MFRTWDEATDETAHLSATGEGRSPSAADGTSLQLSAAEDTAVACATWRPRASSGRSRPRSRASRSSTLRGHAPTGRTSGPSIRTTTTRARAGRRGPSLSGRLVGASGGRIPGQPTTDVALSAGGGLVAAGSEDGPGSSCGTSRRGADRPARGRSHRDPRPRVRPRPAPPTGSRDTGPARGRGPPGLVGCRRQW